MTDTVGVIEYQVAINATTAFATTDLTTAQDLFRKLAATRATKGTFINLIAILSRNDSHPHVLLDQWQWDE